MAPRNNRAAINDELAEAGLAPRRRVRRQPNLPAFGSQEHRALLNLDDPELTPERRGQLEKALAAKPVSQVDPEQKMPVTRDNYVPSTKFGPGDEVVDGWTMVAGQT
jgi:hypothetical protein